MNTKTIIGLIIAGLLVLVAAKTLYIVSETQRAVLLEFGRMKQDDIPPGLHVKIPFVEEVRKFDARVQTLDSRPQRYLTVEKKAMIVDSYVKYRIADVGAFYTATNGDKARVEQLISQRVNEGLRNQFGERTLHEVVSGERDQLMADLNRRINEILLEAMGVEVIDVRVKRIDLPQEVSDSVFDRMTSERQREAREHRAKGREQAAVIRADADRQVVVLEAEAFRDAERIRGDGDAKAANIYARAFNQDREFYTFVRSLNAYKRALANSGDILLLEPDSDFFRYLNDPQGQGNR